MRYRILGILTGLSLSLIVVLILLSLNASAGDVWVPEIVDEGSDNSNGHVSMALDSNDHPHFAHNNELNVEYVYWNGIEWKIETVERGHQGAGWINIALDSQDRPHISYSRWGSVLYASRTGGEWIVENIDTGPQNPGSTDIALDAMDNPYIVYNSPDNSSNMYVHKLNSSWIIEKIPGGGGDRSIAFDLQGYPHMSGATGSPYKLQWTR